MIIEKSIFVQTPTIFIKTEKLLSDMFGCHKLFMFGRAATGFLMAYETIKHLKNEIKEPEIILPSISCATPSNTALICGLKPRYADVNNTNSLIDIEDVKRKVTPNTVAVLYIHLFGNTDSSDILNLKTWCNEKNIYLIEDVAQSLGGIINETNISGSAGDFTIFSFNKTKIIESGGGALGVKTEKLYNAVLEYAALGGYSQLESKEASDLSASYRNLHLSLVAQKRKNIDSDIYETFNLERKKYGGLFYKEIFNNLTIESQLENLKSSLAIRYSKARIYETRLSSLPQIKILSGWQNSGCCWRFSFLINSPDKLENFSEEVRKDGFHLSNLYWPVNHFFNPTDKCSNAEYVARRIVNTWVDEEVSIEWIEKCCDSIIKNSKLLS